jgi:hypothetical protein
MPSTELELVIQASRWLQAYALDRTATGIARISEFSSYLILI